MLLRDPVFDLVTFEAEEERIVPRLLATREVQRLRRIKQLGVTHLVFPGAEHSRFTHALGAAHVMTRMIRRLRQLHEDLPFWLRLASDRAQDALAAALLHDLGHGPFSHLFEEALPNAPRHELWSLAIVRDDGTQVNRVLRTFDPALPERVASLIVGEPYARPYELPYLSRAISGTFDVDRCDYLLRDAHMTGVRYGLFDLDWLLRSLRFTEGPQGPRFAIDGMKGLPAIEGFVMARRFMFEQVYLHKATRAAEVLVKAILRRAAHVLADGGVLASVPQALVLAARGQAVSLGAYLDLDDVALGAAFAAWENAGDRILEDLCRRFRDRVLNKTIDLTGEPQAMVDQRVEQAHVACRAMGLDPHYYVTLDIAEDIQTFGGDATDDSHDEPLEVILAGGCVRPLGAVSPVLARLSGLPLRRVRLLVPAEIREAVNAQRAPEPRT